MKWNASLRAELERNETLARMAMDYGQSSAVFAQSLFSVKTYGAVGNGIVDDTPAITRAINAAALVGGSVAFPAGNFLTTGIIIKDQVVNLIGISGPANEAGGFGSIISSTTTAPIVAYTNAVSTTFTTSGSTVLNFKSPTTGFSVGNKICVMQQAAKSFGAMTFDRTAVGGSATQLYAFILSINGSVVTVDGKASTTNNASLGASNPLGIPIRRIDQLSSLCRVSNLSLRGNLAQTTTSVTVTTEPVTSMQVVSAAGLQVGWWMNIVGFGTKVVSGQPNELNPNDQFIITNISGNTVSFWPPTRRDIDMPSGTPVRCQHGLVVDNAGLLFDLLDVESTGGKGVYVVNSTGSKFDIYTSTNTQDDSFCIDSTIPPRWTGVTTFANGRPILAQAMGGHGLWANGFGTNIEWASFSSGSKSGLVLEGMNDQFSTSLAASKSPLTLCCEQNTLVDQYTKGSQYNQIFYIHSTGGGTASTTTSGGFTQPAIGAVVTINTNGTTGFVQNQKINIASGGIYVISKLYADGISLDLLNNGDTGNAAPGATVGNASAITPAYGAVPADAGRSNDVEFSANNLAPNLSQRKFSQPAVNRQQKVITGATQTLDVRQSHYWEATITGNVTGTPGLAFSNSMEGDKLDVDIIQGTGGGFTISNWSTSIKNPDTTQFAPTLNSGAGAHNFFSFVFDGSTWWLRSKSQ